MANKLMLTDAAYATLQYLTVR